MRNGKKKNGETLIFPKVFKLFTHGIGCFGAGLGKLFRLYKGLYVSDVTHTKSLRKSKKNS